MALIFGSYPCAFLGAVPPQPYQHWEWRWRDLLTANPGVHFAWHSDAPVTPLSPIINLHNMVNDTQIDRDGVTVCPAPSWMPARKLTVQQALPMMTLEAAYALDRDSEVGSLKVGKYADLVVLSANPLAVQPQAIKDIQVRMTIVGGKVEYCAAGQEAVCPGFGSVQHVP